MKVGFSYYLNRAESGDTFWGGVWKAGLKGGMRDQGRNRRAIGRGQQEDPTEFLNPLPPPPMPSSPTTWHAVDVSLLCQDSGLQLVMSECPFCWLLGCWISVVGSVVWLRWCCYDQNVVHMPRSQEFAPLFPLLSHPPVVEQGQRGWEGNGYLHHCRCCFSRGLPAPH